MAGDYDYAPYTPQKKEADQKELQMAKENYSSDNLANYLANIGIELGENGRTPQSGGVPRLFLVKDGKAVTLEESKDTGVLPRDSYNARRPSTW